MVEISEWIRNIEVKPYHHNEINTSEKENRTCVICFLRNLNVFFLKIWGLRTDLMPFQCRRLFTLIWKENFAICNCEKRPLLFAALPHIELAQIYFVLFICFYLKVKEEILSGQNRLVPSRCLHVFWGWATINMAVCARAANQNTGDNSGLVE